MVNRAFKFRTVNNKNAKITKSINRKSCMAYRMARLQVTLGEAEGQFRLFKLF